MPVANPQSFRLEARSQIVCAVCGKSQPFHAHHVVDQQTLKNRCGLSGNALYDTRNALRLCQALGDPDCRCHFQHEHSRRKVKTVELTDDNIEYAFEKLGAYAADYLRRDYDDEERDPRIVERSWRLRSSLSGGQVAVLRSRA
jgi:hypothetical protein